MRLIQAQLIDHRYVPVFCFLFLPVEIHQHHFRLHRLHFLAAAVGCNLAGFAAHYQLVDIAVVDHIAVAVAVAAEVVAEVVAVGIVAAVVAADFEVQDLVAQVALAVVDIVVAVVVVAQEALPA